MSHSHVRVFVHYVWSTWNRESLIRRDWQPRLYACLQAEVRSLGCEVVAVGGTSDHVHALVRLCTTVSIAQVVKQMKGASSHLINREWAGGAFRWQGTYAAETVSEEAVRTVSAYIHNQSERHGAIT